MSFVDKMVLDDEFGSCENSASRMPVRIVQGAQYMNDAARSVLGKFTQTRNYQKSTEFRGGIWDCNPVKEKVISAPSCMDTSNNFTNKIFSLEEMLACYDDESDTEMKDDDSLSSQNEPAEVSANASCTDMTVDLNNKRWRSEEFDKAFLLPCNDSEATRKKPKKTVSFSDAVVNYTIDDSPKPTDIARKCVDVDVIVIEDKVNNLRETVNFKESNRRKNLVMSVSEDVNDIPVKMEDNRSVSEKKSALKGSVKVEKWIKLVSQSSENQLPYEQVESISSKNSISKERHRNRKMESNDCITEHETILKRSGITHKVKNEELINCSHLENTMPELFEFVESKTEDRIDRKSANKKLKDELIQDADELSNIRNIALEIKKTSQSSKKKSPMKVVPPHIEIDLTKNEVESNSFEKDNALKQKENEEHLKNVLSKLFNDDDIAESIKKQLVELKNKMDVMSEKEKNKSLLQDKEVNFVPMVEHNKLGVDRPKKEQTSCIRKLSDDESQYESRNSTAQKGKVYYPPICEKPTYEQPIFERNERMGKDEMIEAIPERTDSSYGRERIVHMVSEDESQYESRNSTAQKEKVYYPPICEKPTYKQPIFERNERMGKDEMIEAIPEITDSSYGKVSPTLHQGEKNLKNSFSGSRSDSCSNWRTQCIDVQPKDMNEDTTPQNSAWPRRNEYTHSANKASRGNDHYFNRNRKEKFSNKMDTSLDIEYIDDPLRVIPLNLSEPPDPLSRFRVTNNDPESIWDEPEEKTMPPRKNNLTTDLKTGSKPEEFHAQLFRKDKTTSIPRFFDVPTQINVDYNVQTKMSKDFKHSSPPKNDNVLPVKLNENYRTRSQSQRRSFERNRSSSAHWRSPVSATYLVHDVFFIIKIKSHQDCAVEKLKILKEEFLEIKRENVKLSEIIPYPGYQPRKISYSACAVKVFVRCLFSLSYKIPNWMTALEAFSLGRKFGVNDLMQECEAYFRNYRIPSEQIHQVAICARQLQAVEALDSSNFFQKVQNIKSFTDQNIYTPQSCHVSCSVLAEPSEFVIPLLLEINRGLESCNEADVKNSVFFRSLTGVSCLTGIQLKFLTEDIHSCTELHIVCEVFQSKKKLFCDEFDTKAKSSIKIPFEEEIYVKLSEQVEISVFIDSVLLKLLPKLTDSEFVSQGKFHAQFESSKTIDKNKLFCIEKLFYTSQA